MDIVHDTSVRNQPHTFSNLVPGYPYVTESDDEFNDVVVMACHSSSKRGFHPFADYLVDLATGVIYTTAEMMGCTFHDADAHLVISKEES